MFKERRPLGAKFSTKATDTCSATTTTGKSLDPKDELTGLGKDLNSASGRFSGDADGFGA